jgi:hypothetical protein
MYRGRKPTEYQYIYMFDNNVLFYFGYYPRIRRGIASKGSADLARAKYSKWNVINSGPSQAKSWVILDSLKG